VSNDKFDDLFSDDQGSGVDNKEGNFDNKPVINKPVINKPINKSSIKKVTFDLDLDFYKTLNRYAFDRDVTMSAVIREALKRYMEDGG